MSKVKRINGQKIAKAPKSTLLYLFLIPMLISTTKSLFGGDYSAFILKGIGFLLLSGGLTMATKGFNQKIAYDAAALTRAPKIPFLKLAALTLGVTAFYLSFFVGGKPLLTALFVGILAPVGFYLSYGFDPKADKLGNIEGISAELVLQTLKEAREKLSHIKADMEQIHDKALIQKLSLATDKADAILKTIQEDPKDIRVARKFLIVYIDGIGKVTRAYTEIEEDEIAADTKIKLYTLMDEVEEKFTSELQRLKTNNHFDLDLHIDVLKEQIKH